MRKVGIITDSNSGIKPDQAKDMGISVVPMPFIIGEETYYEEISLSRKEFFQRMEEGQKRFRKSARDEYDGRGVGKVK